jgi:hypothetical protein
VRTEATALRRSKRRGAEKPFAQEDSGTPYQSRMDKPQVAFSIFEKAQQLGSAS